MNFLKRLLLILLSLSLAALVTGLFLSPESIERIAESIEAIPYFLRVLLVAIADLLILVILYFQVRPAPHPNKNGLIVRASGALADVSVESASERILRAVREVPDVVSAQTKLIAVNGKADIDMDVVVAGANVNVPNKQKEIDRALQQVTLKQLGLQLANRPRVHIQLESERPVSAPVVAAPVPSAPVVVPTIVETPVVSSPPPVVVQPAPRDEALSWLRQLDEDAAAVSSTSPGAARPVETDNAEPDFDLDRRMLDDIDPDRHKSVVIESSDPDSTGLYQRDAERRSDERTSDDEDATPPPSAQP